MILGCTQAGIVGISNNTTLEITMNVLRVLPVILLPLVLALSACNPHEYLINTDDPYDFREDPTIDNKCGNKIMTSLIENEKSLKPKARLIRDAKRKVNRDCRI